MLVAFAAAWPGTSPSASAETISESFAPNVRVNGMAQDGPGFLHQVEPSMVVNSTGRIFIGWKEALTHHGAGQRVAFAFSDDGAIFSPKILMDLVELDRQSDPWLTLTGDGVVHFTRLEFAGDGSESGVTVSNTTDGIRWGTPHFLREDPNFADKETVAHDVMGNMYRMWNSNSATSFDIAFARSDNGGATWTPRVLVNDRPNGTLGVFVHVHPNGTVLAAWWSWLTGDIMFDRSLDGGLTWSTDVRVNDVPGSAALPDDEFSPQPPLPAIAVDGKGTIYVTWTDYRAPRGADVFIARSLDGGVTWSPNVQVNDDDTIEHQWMPDLVIGPDDTVHIAWMDARRGGLNVYYARSINRGLAFSPNAVVTTAETHRSFTRPGDYLSIVVDARENVYVAWTDGRSGDLDIFFAKRVPSGSTTDLPWRAIFIAIAAGAATGVGLIILVRRRRRRTPPPPGP